MEWTQFLIMLVTVAGLFMWSRSESHSEILAMRAEFSAMHHEIHAEMKDFHGRLCAIEEKNRGK